MLGGRSLYLTATQCFEPYLVLGVGIVSQKLPSYGDTNLETQINVNIGSLCVPYMLEKGAYYQIGRRGLSTPNGEVNYIY